MFFSIFEDEEGNWRWTLYSIDHRKVATSGEPYLIKDDCMAAIALVKGSNVAPIYFRD